MSFNSRARCLSSLKEGSKNSPLANYEIVNLAC